MKINLLGYDTLLIVNLTDLPGKLLPPSSGYSSTSNQTLRHTSENFNLQIQTALNNFTHSYVWAGLP